MINRKIKRAAALMLAAMMALACAGCAASADGKTIVTSFYPMYVFTQNVAANVPGVSVVNMADQNVGCLHDYALRTGDMRNTKWEEYIK